MRTIETKLYTVTELKELHPNGFERALNDWRNSNDLDRPFWHREIFDSLKKCIECAGLRLADYNLGAYNCGNFLSMREFQGEDLTGKRAFAWLENNLLAQFRIPRTGKRRAELRKFIGSYPLGSHFYAPGTVAPCPLTGYCADDDYIDALKKSIREGRTVKEAFEDLADTYADILEREIEGENSEAYFIEHADANSYEFNEDGKLQ